MADYHTNTSTAVNSPQQQCTKPSAVNGQDPQNGGYKSSLEEYELAGEERQPFILTVAEMKLLGIAGVSKIFPLGSRVTAFR